MLVSNFGITVQLTVGRKLLCAARLRFMKRLNLVYVSTGKKSLHRLKF